MKLKSKNNSELEGTPQEIHDFCQNNGLNFDNFFVEPISKKWLTGACILWGILLLVAIFLPIAEIKWRTLLLILMCANSLGIGLIVKHQFNQDYTIITIFLVIFSLVAVGFVPVEKMFEYINKLKP
ncbi:hypothetical protein [Acinetobacter johnsonii]|uniref:hypothetical protein n=1 Tax=Acinetobacter johnsonii TaxID=40214 RepID=UPI0007B40DA8|nr:hypothetical protein [Acinetobacter johnsonii]